MTANVSKLSGYKKEYAAECSKRSAKQRFQQMERQRQGDEAK